MYVTFANLGNHGQLGNQLFQIAATLGTARLNHCDFVLPPWKYSEYFENRLPEQAAIHYDCVYEEPDFSYLPITVKESTSISGYFQSQRYFEHCMQELRYYLMPNATFQQTIEEYRKKYQLDIPQRRTCSLCVRRGDYIGNPRFVDLSKTDYYVNVMKMMPSDTKWIIFSDDVEWCRIYFSNELFAEYELTFIDLIPELLTMFLIASCENHILANSTFGWWGAWLNTSQKKRIIAPGVWFSSVVQDESRPYRHENGYHNTKDLIPAGWEVLPVTPMES